MERSFELFPQDSTGQALWEMIVAGDDISQSREIEFSVLFPTKELALKFGQVLLENSQKLSFCPYQDDAEFPWEITAYPNVVASHENITNYERLLTTSSAPFQGKFDGWFIAPMPKMTTTQSAS